MRCYELVVENGGKEEYTATSSCPGTGVNPVTSDDDNTFVARALFFETPQVLSANALGNIVYLPFSGAHRWHRTFVHRLSIANAAEDGVNEKAQLAIKLYDGGIERPLLVFKRDLVDDPKVLG